MISPNYLDGVSADYLIMANLTVYKLKIGFVGGTTRESWLRLCLWQGAVGRYCCTAGSCDLYFKFSQFKLYSNRINDLNLVYNSNRINDLNLVYNSNRINDLDLVYNSNRINDLDLVYNSNRINDLDLVYNSNRING